MSDRERPSENFPGLTEHRETTIDTLTQCYADDLLSVEEFEKRVEKAQNAETYRELELLLEDLPAAYRTGANTPSIAPQRTAPTAPSKPDPPAMASNHVTSILGERQVTADIFAGGYGSAVAVMGTLDLDLDVSNLTETELTLNVFGLMSDINLNVPADTRVELDITPVLADVKLRGQNTPKSEAKRTLRVTGVAIMSDLKVRR